MPFPNNSLLSTDSLSTDQLFSIFRTADRLRMHGFRSDSQSSGMSKGDARVIACVFLEPSTRTRLSFQIAAYRLGYEAVLFEHSNSSSLVKGETFTDTALNITAMQPDLLVIRYGESAELDALLPELSVPVVNAGSGIAAHPTQALLDAYTILQARGKVEGEKVLIVGDIKHSRVAQSNLDVLKKLGAQIAISGPPEYLLPNSVCLQQGIRVFENLDEGVQWASVYMGLRVQLERHARPAGQGASSPPSHLEDYHRRFGLNQARLQQLAKNALILHPGPVNHGIEFSLEVGRDPRSLVMKQVENGVLIRAALMAQLLKTHSFATGQSIG